jgi:hypothetical protein
MGYNVVIVDTRVSLNANYPRIIGRMKDLSGRSKNPHLQTILTTNPCGLYETCDDSIYIFCCDRPLISDQELESHAESIIGYLIVVTFKSKNLSEVYDVVVDSQFHNKGVGSFLFTHVLRLFSSLTIWLAIIPTNPSWNEALGLYTKFGFHSPMLTNTTAGGRHLNFYVVSLTRYSGNTINDEKSRYNTIHAANELRFQYLKTQLSCSHWIHVGLKVCLKLKEYINRDVEIGGILLQDKNITHNGKRYGNLVYPIQTEIEGNKDTFAVESPTTFYNFHTHPAICYDKFNCFVGFPSAQDMGYIVMNYHLGLRKHFVITVEGIYSVQMTPPFMAYWTVVSLNNDIANDITNTIRSFYIASEDLRKTFNLPPGGKDDGDSFILNSHKLALFQHYITVSNTLSFSQLTPKLNGFLPYPTPPKDFVLFMVKFFSWADIAAHKGFIDTVEYHPDNLTCNIDTSFVGVDD